MKNITKYFGSLSIVFVSLVALAMVNIESAQAWHISGFQIKGGTPSWLGGDGDSSSASAVTAPTPAITSASCYANANNLPLNGFATWTATASGGNGAFTYSWSGTDALSGSGATISKQYIVSGIKSAVVTINSGTQTLTVSCGNTINVSTDQNNNNNNSSISGYCYPNTTSVSTNNSVTWTANVVGGNGSYNYSWTGTDSLSGSGSSIYKTYYYSGTKTASVYVTSGTQSATIYCSNSVGVLDNYYNNNYNYNNYGYGNLSVTCQPSIYNANIGETIYWYATASGGNGNYTYSWTGTDDMFGSGSSLSRVYWLAGSKTASVTVYSNGQTATQYCNSAVNVLSNYNNGYYNNYNNSNAYNNYNYLQPLNVTCSANTISTLSGDTVVWTAVPTGGVGTYTYNWSGIDGLYGSNQTVSKNYWLPGVKTAGLTVTSGVQSVTRTCSNLVTVSVRPITLVNTTPTTGGDYPPTTTYVAPKTYPQLEVACSANTATANVNDTVVWIAAAKGGSGTYTYKWEGSEGIAGTTNYVAKNYYDNGIKTTVLTVASAGQTLTKVCGTVNVGNVSVATSTNMNLGASSFFGGWAGWILLIVLMATVIFMGIMLYFLNLKHSVPPVK